MDTAIILAGGSAIRFGRPKALEEVDGKPLVRHVFEAVERCAEEIVVSLANRLMADVMRRVLPDARFVIDRRRGKGPIEGILRGVEVAQGERLLVAPCDAPLLRSELYSLLLASLGDHDAAVPRFHVFDPVRAVYRIAAVRRVLGVGTKPPASPSALVDRLDAVFVEEDRLRSVDPHLDSFLDVNTEADLQEVFARLRPASRSA